MGLCLGLRAKSLNECFATEGCKSHAKLKGNKNYELLYDFHMFFDQNNELLYDFNMIFYQNNEFLIKKITSKLRNLQHLKKKAPAAAF